MTEFDRRSTPQAWGSFEDAEKLRRWAFLQKTPEQRLAWLVEILEIAYATGAIKPRRPDAAEAPAAVAQTPGTHKAR